MKKTRKIRAEQCNIPLVSLEKGDALFETIIYLMIQMRRLRIGN
jgi:hypothetical protein